MRNILFFSLLVASVNALAFKLSPMVVNFAPNGSKSTQVLTLENNANEKVPVQVEVFTREVDSKGEEVRKPTEDFNVYPEQLVLLPNEKRNVRVTYTAGKNAGIEQAYRIVATQVPVEFKDRNAKAQTKKTSLNFLIQYVASAYVAPDGVFPKVIIKDSQLVSGKKLAVTIVNEGSAHKVLKAKTLRILSGKDKLIEVANPTELDAVNFLAKMERTITFTLPKEVKVDKSTKITAEFDYLETGD